MRKSEKVFGTIAIVAILAGCASPQATKLPPQAYKTNSVNQFLKTAKHEFFTLSPTQTFALGYDKIQLDLNKWCIEKGGTPYYYYKDQFGDYVSKKLVYYDNHGKPHPKYVTDLTEDSDSYVVCKLPNGKELYRYKQYDLDTHCQHILNSSCWHYVGTLIFHAPEKETYYYEDEDKPTSFKALADYVKCRGNYCYGKWYISYLSYLGGWDFARPYLYCKYHLGGVLYKDGQRWEDWFKQYILKEHIGFDWDANYKYLTGKYFCYDGENSFKLIATFGDYWTNLNDIILRVSYKKAPELANQKPTGHISVEIGKVGTKTTENYANPQTEAVPTAFSSDKEIALYVAKTGEPFNAVAGSVMVQATPVKEGECTLVLIQRFNNGFLAEKKSVKVCNNKVVSSSDVHPTREPTPGNIQFGLVQIIPQCQQFGKASTNFVGYTIECKALDENHCDLQITTRKGDKVLSVQTVNVCH